MFDFPLELARTNELLERIAVALERAIPLTATPAYKLRGPESLVDMSGEAVSFRLKRDRFFDDQNFTPAERLQARRDFDDLPAQLQEKYLEGYGE